MCIYVVANVYVTMYIICTYLSKKQYIRLLRDIEWCQHKEEFIYHRNVITFRTFCQILAKQFIYTHVINIETQKIWLHTYTYVHTHVCGSCSKVGSYLSYQDTFVCRKITFLWSDSKNWGGAQPPNFPYSTACGSDCQLAQTKMLWLLTVASTVHSKMFYSH